MEYKTLHPALTVERRFEWQLMRDAMDGETRVKARGTEYLPMPGGFAAQNDGGKGMYEAYKRRARFPEILAPSVSAMIGIIHGREIQIEMPDGMSFLWENADGNGLPLEALHRRITRELLVIGGYAILADAPEGGGDPYLCGYTRDAVINWDTDWYVLDETGIRRDGFVWKQLERYRALGLIVPGPAYQQMIYTPDTTFAQEVQVRGRGGALLPRIPFVIGNARDLSTRIEAPPLIGVARAALAMYQLAADYRHQLFMSGQETLVALNGPAPKAVGAGVVHEMRGDGLTAPDLKYVSPTCSGIEAHKAAMEAELHAAIMSGARLFEQTDGGQESGEARRLRFASETATLTSIAQASAMVLERSLRNIAMIMGLPEDGITVPAPTDLLDRSMSAADLAALFGVYQAGGMSWQTYYENAQRGGLMSPERDAEAEFALVDDRTDEAI
jgi:hypothetical protein